MKRVFNPLRNKKGKALSDAAMAHWFSRNALRSEIITKEDAILAQNQKRAV